MFSAYFIHTAYFIVISYGLRQYNLIIIFNVFSLNTNDWNLKVLWKGKVRGKGFQFLTKILSSIMQHSFLDFINVSLHAISLLKIISYYYLIIASW